MEELNCYYTNLNDLVDLFFNYNLQELNAYLLKILSPILHKLKKYDKKKDNGDFNNLSLSPIEVFSLQ